MIGKNILHYKIIEKLGQGGMGVVYKAQDTKLDRFVAIKFLPSHIAASEEDRERFKIEAQAAAALNHPNISTIHAIEEFEDEVFLVMEFINGQDLKSIAGAKHFLVLLLKILELHGENASPLPIDEILNIAFQIAEGLHAAHKKNIVHRDIKSANIMVTESGQVKIMDFGLAKVRGSAQLTKVGTTLGTVAYMSPEQAKGEDVDQRSDIWSFGVVLYEMLTGQLPFKGDYEQAVIYSILNEEPKPISLVNSRVTLQLEELVIQTLAKNPDERFQNIDELQVNLKATGDRLKGVDRKATVSQNKGSKRKTPFLYAGISVIIVLITLMSILFFPQKEQGKSNDLIAVLPFSNTKPDPETDYLGFAIADQII